VRSGGRTAARLRPRRLSGAPPRPGYWRAHQAPSLRETVLPALARPYRPGPAAGGIGPGWVHFLRITGIPVLTGLPAATAKYPPGGEDEHRQRVPHPGLLTGRHGGSLET
jgi:hypothetical protein